MNLIIEKIIWSCWGSSASKRAQETKWLRSGSRSIGCWSSRGQLNKQGSNDDGDDASLEVCFQTSIGPPDDRSTFEKMEKALNKALEVSNSSDRDSPSSDGSMRSDVGAASSTSTPHILSRLDDEDYVANNVADVRRRRSKKNVQQTYWLTKRPTRREREVRDFEEDTTFEFEGTVISEHTRAREDTTLAGIILSSSTREETTIMSGSTKHVPVPEKPTILTEPKFLAEEEDDDDEENESTGDRAFGIIHNFCSEARDFDFEEDTTLEFEGTVISEYTPEDTTLAGIILSSSTREETTIMSGSTKHVPEKPTLLTEPKFLAEEEDDDDEKESTGDKAFGFGIIHNFCSGSFWFRGADQQSSQSETEGASGQRTKESVGALSVKEHLNRTRSKLSVTQGLGESATLDVKEIEYDSKTNNKSIVGSYVITSFSQNRLKAIYERNMVKSFHKSPNTSQLDAPRRAEDDDTVEISNRRQQTTSNAMGCKSIKAAKATTTITGERKKKRFRPKLFSFSPARTVATTGTSDTESRGSSDGDEDDDVCASYRALGKTLISI